MEAEKVFCGSAIYIFRQGFFRRFGIEINRGVLRIIAIGCTIMLWIPNMVNISVFNFLKTYEWNYHSLPTYIGALSLFLIFASLKQNTGKLDGFIRLVSGLTFGVFLIHDNAHLRVLIWNKISEYLPKEGFTIATLWIIPVTIITVFSMCSCLEYLRQKLFKTLHVILILN